jgi:hypothetical protein
MQIVADIFRDFDKFNLKSTTVKGYQYPTGEYEAWPRAIYNRMNNLKRAGLDAIDVAMLSFSYTFLKAAEHYKDHEWAEAVQLLVENSQSTRLFVQSRNMPWLENLKAGPFSKHRKAESAKHDHKLFLGKHHLFYLPIKGEPRQCRFLPTNEPMKEVPDCFFDEQNFSLAKRPVGYPSTWDYPGDIQSPRGPSGIYRYCNICLKPSGPPRRPGICCCNIPRLFGKSLVEIREYPSHADSEQVNRGVRALQNFRAGDFIGEYVGELVPVKDSDKFGDTIYAMFFDRADVMGQSDGGAAMIISGRSGNWTRFINHDKDPNVEFHTATVGRKHRVVIKTVKDIRFGDEMLVDYGDLYFS